MKDIWKEKEENIVTPKINKQKLIITIIIATIAVIGIIIIGAYYTNKPVREWVDKNIFRKEILQNKATTIELKEGQNANVYAFNKYIGILNQAKFILYSNNGNKEKELDMQISNPIYSSANRFLAVAEKNGQKLYIVSDKDILWNTNVEGNISQVFINKNGYVAVVITGTSHKSVIKMYNPSGEPMFTQFLSTTRAIDVTISNDNKHLAIAEVDTSGTAIQSNIKVISVEKAEKNSEDYLENTYSSETGKLLTNIRYQNKNKLVCMYTDSISVIEDGKENTLVDNKDKKVIFQSIDMDDNICSIEEKSSGLFTADSVVSIINIDNKSTKEYTVNYVAKEIFTNVDIIALNLGTEVEFINTGGWLVKRYVANQEITNIVVSNNIAGIVYRDKIEIIDL